MKCILGIDPGLAGGLAFMTPDGKIVDTCVMPTRILQKGKRDIDVHVLDAYLEQYEVMLAVVEKVHATPKMASNSLFTFGRGVGKLLAVLELRNIPLEEPRPQQWKKVILIDTKRDKVDAIAYVRKRFPKCNLLPTLKCTKFHDGMAEAVCIAEFGRRTYLKITSDGVYQNA